MSNRCRCVTITMQPALDAWVKAEVERRNKKGKLYTKQANYSRIINEAVYEKAERGK